MNSPSNEYSRSFAQLRNSVRCEGNARNRVTLIRNWVFRLCPKAVDSELAIDNQGPRDLYRLTRWGPLLADGRIGTWCGSSAILFKQALSEFGYRSACVD